MYNPKRQKCIFLATARKIFSNCQRSSKELSIVVGQPQTQEPLEIFGEVSLIIVILCKLSLLMSLKVDNLQTNFKTKKENRGIARSLALDFTAGTMLWVWDRDYRIISWASFPLVANIFAWSDFCRLKPWIVNI